MDDLRTARANRMPARRALRRASFQAPRSAPRCQGQVNLSRPEKFVRVTGLTLSDGLPIIFASIPPGIVQKEPVSVRRLAGWILTAVLIAIASPAFALESADWFKASGFTVMEAVGSQELGYALVGTDDKGVFTILSKGDWF